MCRKIRSHYYYYVLIFEGSTRGLLEENRKSHDMKDVWWEPYSLIFFSFLKSLIFHAGLMSLLYLLFYIHLHVCNLCCTIAGPPSISVFYSLMGLPWVNKTK